MSTTTPPELEGFDQYKFGWHDPSNSVFEPKKGLSADVVREISALKGEPEWMTKFRLRSLEIFDRKPMPNWGGDLDGIDFQDIYYYIRASEKQGRTWEEVRTTSRTRSTGSGSPRPSAKFLAGVSAQYESEVVYHPIREDLEAQGVIFCDTDTALREHPEIFGEHWATVIPPGDNKFSALNSAVWSGGSFIWVPPGVRVEIPLQAYFRINQENMGAVRADAHHLRGGLLRALRSKACPPAPVYSSDSLHSAVVRSSSRRARAALHDDPELVDHVYNLVTKRAVCHENATMEWCRRQPRLAPHDEVPGGVDARSRRARGECCRSRSPASTCTRTPAPRWCTSRQTRPRQSCPSISKGGGRTSYRGLVRVEPGAKRVKASVVCDACCSTRTAAPTLSLHGHPGGGHLHRPRGHGFEVADDQLFYLMSRGLSEEAAMAMIVRGFIEPIAKELPMEYAVELNRLIELQMEGSIG